MSVNAGISTLDLFILHEENAVLKATLFIDWLEKTIFGSIPAFELIKIFGGSLTEKLFLYSYNMLLPVILVSFLATALLSKKAFRIYLVASFVALIISLPFWIIVPATSPDGLYMAKIFGAETPGNVPSLASVSETFQKNRAFFHSIWISPNNSFFNVTSIPSLHAAWGVISAFGLFMINRWVGLLLLPWLLVNLVGTFYSLQHYAVDVIFGVILGLFCVYLAKWLIELEKKYYQGKDWYLFCDFLSNRDKSE